MSLPHRLTAHLESWLGAWPDEGPSSLIVTTAPLRSAPGWDGKIRPVRGVSTPAGTVLSVPADRVADVRSLGSTIAEIGPRLPEALDLPTWTFSEGVFRWTEEPVAFDRPGTWIPTTDDRVLPWLRPFNGDVLVGFEGGDVTAGVGRKIHDEHGHELAVVTEPDHRGQGWASRLVSQAAERTLDEGAIPTYLHSPDNEASARTADAVGFPDRGWRILGLFPGKPG